MTQYYNKFWRSGILLKQGKRAKAILIQKPGKTPDTKNLCQISLTSCVGKVLELVVANEWQDDIKGENLYPNYMIGFSRKLSTQDAMLQLKEEVLDEAGTGENRAILGLDLHSAFDKSSTQHYWHIFPSSTWVRQVIITFPTS